MINFLLGKNLLSVCQLLASTLFYSTDHPFNPHVFLKRTLTSEDVDTIMTGNVPPQLLAKFKKVNFS